ncbi:DUF443 family protein [Pseudogracilibacillus auburnensis]|uniref:Putative membrane protein (TIGR01218 family) n=1 Tax=Pseudogracilibacillus auburnensis TaxID=1494959 RepID=A0A2V3VWL1_9BACI|nr:DUF443 family protein [Pseudogracilibacillus auburnensis]MBO1002266.1 DUF443 family protein [Pseudogracilibacillus auburnensis]PXW86347.1 putative membrane protein (TIGR01218 family) [Pseudogracilibacillus auburnensis]
MNCKVEHVYKNMRYKILKFNGEVYILDMDRSFWTIFIPFIYWFIPHKCYKIDNETYNLIQMTEEKQISVGSMALLGGGVSILFVNLLKPLFYELNIPTTIGINSIALSLVIILSFLVRLFIHKRLYNNLHKIIDLNKAPIIKLKVRPSKTNYFLKYSFSFLFSWGLASLFGFAFIHFGNIIVLLGGFILLFLGLILNLQAIPIGRTKVHVLNEC